MASDYDYGLHCPTLMTEVMITGNFDLVHRWNIIFTDTTLERQPLPLAVWAS